MALNEDLDSFVILPKCVQLLEESLQAMTLHIWGMTAFVACRAVRPVMELVPSNVLGYQALEVIAGGAENLAAAFSSSVVRMEALALSMAADSLERYITGSLTSLFTDIPHAMLKSDRKASKEEQESHKEMISVSLRDVLEYSKEELVRRSVEKRIFSLGHRSFLDLLKYVNSLGLDVDLHDEDVKIADEAFAIRNLFVHNDGKASTTFTERWPEPRLLTRATTPGEALPVTSSFAFDAIGAFVSVALDLDLMFQEKFRMAGVPMRHVLQKTDTVSSRMKSAGQAMGVILSFIERKLRETNEADRK